MNAQVDAMLAAPSTFGDLNWVQAYNRIVNVRRVQNIRSEVAGVGFGIGDPVAEVRIQHSYLSLNM